MKTKTTSELREEVEKHLDSFYGDDFGHFTSSSKTRHVADYFQEVLHQREQQIYAELMEKIEPPKEWRHCLKVAFGQEETCALCGFCPEKLKSIINNIFKHAE